MNDSTGPAGTDDGFEDPTAPTWSTPEPTQPIPAEPPVAAEPPMAAEPPVTPPSPYAAPDPGPAPVPDPWGPPPAPPQQYPPADPYAAPPPGQPVYGEQLPYPPPPYGQAPYGQAPYGQQPPGSTAYGQAPYSLPPAPYGAPPYGAQPSSNTSAIVLTVVSGIATVMCCLFGLPSLVLGIMALTKQSADPTASARLTRAGWITFGVLTALAVLIGIGFAVAGSFDTSSSTGFDGT